MYLNRFLTFSLNQSIISTMSKSPQILNDFLSPATQPVLYLCSLALCFYLYILASYYTGSIFEELRGDKLFEHSKGIRKKLKAIFYPKCMCETIVNNLDVAINLNVFFRFKKITCA